MKEINITGKKFGKLTALRKVGKDKWLFRCDCGKEKEIKKSRVLEGRSKSCGCITKKHGMSGTALEATIAAMIQRCTNPKNPKYKNYGKRGIKVCTEWMKNRKLFFDWALKNGYKKGLSIDRIDNDGNYCPENCRWIPITKQYENMQRTVYIKWKGEIVPLVKIQRQENIKRWELLKYRVKNMESVE